ncbi:MAG: type II toxin-antitoxin system Phd/YefM family antitoxin [Anaerolineae bacterium]
MRIASVANVKAQFSAYLKECQRGPVVVTRDGQPIAALVPILDEDELAVASFRQVFSLPLTYVQLQIRRQRPRLRLLPPYREHLAQAFARFILY